MMNKPDKKEIFSLLNDKNSLRYFFEIYHGLLEYIKSGNSIHDMGHPDFFWGAHGNTDKTIYTSYSPSLAIFQLSKAFSTYLNNFDTKLIWYRDLSTWQKFCKYVVELDQIRYFRRNFSRPIKSYNYYLRVIECPACGLGRNNYRYNPRDKIFLERKDNIISIECRRCGKYIITCSSFKYLDTFEKKSKLFVFLLTREDRDNEKELIIMPKFLKEIIN